MQAVLDEVARSSHTKLADTPVAIHEKFQRDRCSEFCLSARVSNARHEPALPTAHCATNLALVQASASASAGHIQIALGQHHCGALPNHFAICSTQLNPLVDDFQPNVFRVGSLPLLAALSSSLARRRRFLARARVDFGHGYGCGLTSPGLL